MQTGVRIRNNVTSIRELNIPEGKINDLKKKISSPYISSRHARNQITNQDLGVSLCCVCGNIPSHEIQIAVGDEETPMTRVETYCKICIKSVYEKEPEDKEALEERYNITIVDSEEQPRTPREL